MKKELTKELSKELLKAMKDLIKIQDKIYNHAVKLYDETGQTTVTKWGYDLGLPNGWCNACNCDVPVLISPKYFECDCLVCGSGVTNREWQI